MVRNTLVTHDRTEIVKYLQHKAEFEEEDCVAESSRAGLSWNLAFENYLGSNSNVNFFHWWKIARIFLGTRKSVFPRKRKKASKDLIWLIFFSTKMYFPSVVYSRRLWFLGAVEKHVRYREKKIKSMQAKWF